MRIKLALAVFAAWVVWIVVSATVVVLPVRKAEAGLFQYNVTPLPSASATASSTSTPTPTP